MESKPLRIHSIAVENFKRVRVVKLALPPGGRLVEIAGQNGQGKSSFLDAIYATLAGGSASPDVPIRAGARRAESTLDLGEIRVKREWTGSGTRLTVTEGETGTKILRPQELLDSLFARIAFDPLDFTRQTASVQAKTLREIVQLDFSDLDARRAALAEERRDVERAVRSCEARLVDLPDVPPTDEVSLEALNQSLRAARERNAEVGRAKSALQAADAELARINRQREDKLAEAKRIQERIQGTQREILELQARIDRLHEEHDAVMEAAGTIAEAAADAEMERDCLEAQVPEEADTTPILRAMEQASAINDRARQYRERRAAMEEVEANRRHAQKIKEGIEDIDTERQQRLAAAAFPVEGLGLDGDTVTFRGVPFSQASTSEQIRVGLAIGAARNPTLRLLVIKEGSLLDDRSMQLVSDWAEHHDYQVLVERVARSLSGDCGVVIEEGEAVGGPAAAEERDLFPGGAAPLPE